VLSGPFSRPGPDRRERHDQQERTEDEVQRRARDAFSLEPDRGRVLRFTRRSDPPTPVTYRNRAIAAESRRGMRVKPRRRASPQPPFTAERSGIRAVRSSSGTTTRANRDHGRSTTSASGGRSGSTRDRSTRPQRTGSGSEQNAISKHTADSATNPVCAARRTRRHCDCRPRTSARIARCGHAPSPDDAPPHNHYAQYEPRVDTHLKPRDDRVARAAIPSPIRRTSTSRSTAWGRTRFLRAGKRSADMDAPACQTYPARMQRVFQVRYANGGRSSIFLSVEEARHWVDKRMKLSPPPPGIVPAEIIEITPGLAGGTRLIEHYQGK
jgi:hypothetical protein